MDLAAAISIFNRFFKFKVNNIVLYSLYLLLILYIIPFYLYLQLMSIFLSLYFNPYGPVHMSGLTCHH